MSTFETKMHARLGDGWLLCCARDCGARLAKADRVPKYIGYSDEGLIFLRFARGWRMEPTDLRAKAWWGPEVEVGIWQLIPHAQRARKNIDAGRPSGFRGRDSLRMPPLRQATKRFDKAKAYEREVGVDCLIKCPTCGIRQWFVRTNY
jgi:hypothetical protein